ncbi:unnamed protein product [Tilletia controversa]|uniref:Uncharacterized protein n=3 Tax=Tilletia TaxID=13289 RepID=A0A8X7MYU4_9BASI|nr:hypothetical protein CF336_g392 [Tilletia laevis]KAE8202858.1 hypothetical protein CF328_g1978 [Tilletia controversa]KAE8263492.1 hypothetical protein A4X03_0g1641 [Tilletia caries]KAE8207068.1 hypothetical protein CF335_g1415 [Tilletia laevis]KAE8253849.1 hypothetical protein A4X06_0g1183 [Tilletia controversa]
MAAARSLVAAAASARRTPLASLPALHQRTFTTSRSSLAAPTSASSSSSSSASAQDDPNKDPQLGDYPDLPLISLQRRRFSPNWWDTQEKRNFGETLHEQHDAMSVWAPDAHVLPASNALFQFGLAALAMTAFAGAVYLTKFERPAVPRTYPRDGLKAEMGGTELTALSDSEAEEGGGEDAEDSD